MERISALYDRPAYRGRLRVEAGKEPCLALKLRSGARPIQEARAFAAAWGETAPPAAPAS